MTKTPFRDREPHVDGNEALRTPQREAFQALIAHVNSGSDEREIGIILPVGCGKSGCITLAPFAFKSRRTLVVAPGLTIAQQLADDFDPANPSMFYAKTGTLSGPPYPEPTEIRGTTTNVSDIMDADVVITNIQQLQGAENRWLQRLDPDTFDLILFDEGHHSVAESWQLLKERFPQARIVNFSATPQRADGQLMAGAIKYSYPVARAIQEGYVKSLKAIVLNPRTLRYVRREDGVEVEVTLDEVRRLGEEEADFRRSIVTSEETLNTIVDASIRELYKLREEVGDGRLKIIASALNFEHCRQIVEAYHARGLRADYVHSRADTAANQRVLQKLENHELDVIVQVRKLGEGFDHPYLSVAAVFSIFGNLSPFVQFVGRIMRVIDQTPGSPKNRGVVVFHAGANVARRWEDFQAYSEADQEYFDQLLPMEGLDFSSSVEIEVDPSPRFARDEYDIRGQEEVLLQEIPLLAHDEEALEALRLLQSKGYTTDEVATAMNRLAPVPTTRTRERQARRRGLETRVQQAAARILGERDLSTEGHELDYQRLGRNNFVAMKAAIDRQVNAFVGKSSGERSEFTRAELDKVESEFDALVGLAVRQMFDAKD